MMNPFKKTPKKNDLSEDDAFAPLEITEPEARPVAVPTGAVAATAGTAEDKPEVKPEGKPLENPASVAPGESGAESSRPSAAEPGPGPAESQPPVSAPASTSPQASAFQRVLNFLFNPATRLGRALRSGVRGAGIIVGLFALGMLAAYILLYQPQSARLQQAQNSLEQTAAQNASLQKSLTAALEQQKQTSASLEKANARLLLYQTQSWVNQARVALARKEGADALQALKDARSALDPLLPALKKLDPNLASSLDALLTLAQADLNRDPKAASDDLDRLNNELNQTARQVLLAP